MRLAYQGPSVRKAFLMSNDKLPLNYQNGFIMTNFEYLVKDVGMSKAQLEGIMKLADVCGFKPMFESDEVMDFDDFDIGEFEDHIDAAHAKAEEEERQRYDSVKGKSIAQILKENPTEDDTGSAGDDDLGTTEEAKKKLRKINTKKHEDTGDDMIAPVDFAVNNDNNFGIAFGNEDYDDMDSLQTREWTMDDVNAFDTMKNQEEVDQANREMTDPTSVMNEEQKLVVRIIKKLGGIAKEVPGNLKELMVDVAETTRNAEETTDADDSNITYGNEAGDQNEVGDTDEVIDQVEELCKRVRASIASMPESQSTSAINSLKTMIAELTTKYERNPFNRTLDNFLSDISLTTASPSNYRGGVAASKDRFKQMANAALKRVKGL